MTKTLNSRKLNVIFGDTDALAFKKPDQKPFTEEEQEELLSELNSLLPERIKFENDGEYRRFIIIKKKNYLLDDGKTITIKGSGLKGSMKEPALQKFMKEILELLRTDRKDQIYSLYQDYVEKILTLGISSKDKPPTSNIKDWCFKKTITKKLMSSDRKNETRVMDALEGTVTNEGDKVFVFVKEVIDWKKPKKEKKIYELRENFTGKYCKRTLLRKLYDTLEIFDTVIDTSLFPNYSSSKHFKLLDL